MTQNYELIVKGIRNFENKVTVTLALRDKNRFDGEIKEHQTGLPGCCCRVM